MSKLVIAEKPMLARDIARAITGKEVSDSARLPISGNGYTVCACAGHLLELVKPDAIDPKWGMPWSLDVLPIEVHDWPKEPAVDKKTGESKKTLIDQIAGLLKTCDSVIAAGDPDDEGQLIVDELLDYLGYTGKVERVYVNDNIEKNIVRAFDKLVPNDSCRGAGNAAYARQMADMCFGVNETRLATKRLDGLFTVGRVQTPTLGLVVKRDEAIAHHVTRKFYELFASGDSDAGELTFKYLPGKELLAGEKHLFERHTLEALKEKLDGCGLHFETTVSKKQENPPLPYNLTVLLSDMSERFGFTAAQTQQITQDLRDKYKAITYNRSDSQYLKEEHREQAPAVLAQAMKNLGVRWPLDYRLHSKAFNDGNVTAHHGIIPQEADIHVHRVGLPHEVEAPHVVQQGFPGDDPLLVLQQVAQQVKLPAGQLHALTAHLHLVALGVHGERPRGEQAAGLFRGLGGALAQGGPDAGQKLRSAKRLGDVIIRPKIQRLHLFLFPPARGHNDNRHFRPLPHGFEHIQPINVRQAEVEQNHIRPV